METKIKWNEGEGYITATYEGSGNGSASISSDVNEGIDREQSIKVETTDKSVSATLIVSQEGLREVFEPSDGLFVLVDGGTYNVLKVGGDTPDVPVAVYTRLSYLESTGKQYINTGYIVQEDDVIEMQYTKFERTTVVEYMFGTSDSNGNLWAYINSNSIYSRFGSDENKSLSSTRWKNVLTIQRGSVNIDGTTGTLELDGMPQSPLYIFAMNNKGTATGLSTIKTTGFTIYKASGEIVMKLRPCMRNEDGAIGMLDLVSGNFFENLGSADFLYGGGANIHTGYEMMDYLDCKNDKVFDTGVYADKTTYVEVLFRRSVTDVSEYLYGTTSTTSSRFTAYLTSSGYWRYGSGAPTFSINDTLLHYARVTPGKTTVDNTSKTFTVSEFTSPFTIPLGGYTTADGIAVPDYQGHIYYFRMWHGDELVADLMPCKRLSDGVEGFWDCVTQSFVEPI